MATKTWLGDDSGNEGDWLTAANWSASGVPAVDDDLIFDSNANYAVEVSPAGAADYFGDILVTSGFAYDFGTSGAAIIFDGATATDLLVVDAANVPTYFKIDGKFTKVIVMDSGALATSMVIDGTVTDLELQKGTVTLVTGCTVTNLRVTYKSSQTTDVTVTIPTGCTITNVYQRGGTVTCSSAIATKLELDFGVFTHSDGNTGILSLRGGTYYWNCSGDTITEAKLFGGTFDTRNNADAKTITNGEIWPGATAYFNNGGQNLVMTNAFKFYGGTVRFDVGSGFQINQ